MIMKNDLLPLLEPYILLNEFALLRVNYVNQVGAGLGNGKKDI
jgi:hypothetical protein